LGSGFYIGGSYNTICANSLSNSDYGFHFTFTFANPNENILYLNNIYITSTTFTFPILLHIRTGQNQMMGNYWSDYTGWTATATA
jgi:nitrous oxidase accessory protein NosD